MVKQCSECIHNVLCPIKKALYKFENETQRFTIDSRLYEDLAGYCLHFKQRDESGTKKEAV